jgi:SH3-like domain-containing protein
VVSVFDDPEPFPRQKTLYTKASLNVRTGPGAEYKKIEVLKKFQEVQIIKTKGEWAKINYEGKAGWVSMKYLFDKNKMLALQKIEKETVDKKQKISVLGGQKKEKPKMVVTSCIRKCFTEISIRSRNMDEYDIWVEFISRKAALEANTPELYDLCVLQGGLLGAFLAMSEVSDELREKAAYKFCDNCYCF